MMEGLFDDNSIDLFDDDNNIDYKKQEYKYYPEEKKDFSGLTNEGATCYLNSLFQNFYNCEYFKKLIYNINIDSFDNGDAKNIIKSFQLFFFKLDNLNLGKQNIKDILKAFKWDHKEATIQQDIAEARRIILDLINKIIIKINNAEINNKFSEIMKGEINYYLNCDNCNFTSNRKEEFFDINLYIKTFEGLFNDSLEKCLDFYWKPELLDNENKVFCENCNSKQNFYKGVKFNTLPYYLNFTLNRFEIDYFTFERKKINSYCSFPFDLEISANKYSLIGVTIHKGNAYGGHYFCYINIKNLWYLFDDTLVKLVSKEVLENYFGNGNKSENAYILLYKKNENNLDLNNINISNSIKEEVKNLNLKLDEERKQIEIEENTIEMKMYDLNDIVDINFNSFIIKNNFEINKNFIIKIFIKDKLKDLLNIICDKFKCFKFNKFNIFIIKLNIESNLINYDFLGYSSIYKNLSLDDELSKIFQADINYTIGIIDNQEKFIENILPYIGVENTLIYANIEFDSQKNKTVLIRKNILLAELIEKLSKACNKSLNKKNLFIRVKFKEINFAELLTKKTLISILFDGIIFIYKDKNYSTKLKNNIIAIKEENEEEEDDEKPTKEETIIPKLMYVNIIKYEEDGIETIIKENYLLNLEQSIKSMKKILYKDEDIEFKDYLYNYTIYKTDHYKSKIKKYLKEDIILTKLKINNGDRIIFKNINFYFKSEYNTYDIRLIDNENIYNNEKLNTIKIPKFNKIISLYNKIIPMIRKKMNNNSILLQTLNKLDLPTYILKDYTKPLTSIRSSKIGVSLLSNNFYIGLDDILIYIQKRDTENKSYENLTRLVLVNFKSKKKLDENLLDNLKSQIKKHLKISPNKKIILAKRNFEKISYTILDNELKLELKKRTMISEGDIIGYLEINSKFDFSDNMENKDDIDLRMAYYIEKQNKNDIYKNVFKNDDNIDFKINVDI